MKIKLNRTDLGISITAMKHLRSVVVEQIKNKKDRNMTDRAFQTAIDSMLILYSGTEKQDSWITDRQPDTEGVYWVTLEAPSGRFDNGKFKPSGEYERWVAKRTFADPHADDWCLVGEDPLKRHWKLAQESTWMERVIAWQPYDQPGTYKGDQNEATRYRYLRKGEL